MLEILYDIAVCVIYVVGKVLKYTLPIIFVAVGIAIGVSSGYGVAGNTFYNWEDKKIESLCHDVTIHWNNADKDVSYLTVREDLEWNINGCESGDDLYANSNLSVSSLPYYATSWAGHEFLGLYTSSYGGEMVVNAAGYALVTIQYDLDLYAMWGNT
jgi:hypothetical protein